MSERVPKDGLGLQIFAPGRLYFLPRGCTPQVQRHLPSPPVLAQSLSVRTFSHAPKLPPSGSAPVASGWQNQPPQMQRSAGQVPLALKTMQSVAGGGTEALPAPAPAAAGSAAAASAAAAL